jgi:hypothetical protein
MNGLGEKASWVRFAKRGKKQGINGGKRAEREIFRRKRRQMGREFRRQETEDRRYRRGVDHQDSKGNGNGGKLARAGFGGILSAPLEGNLYGKGI